jgi:hypothetical protein
MNAKLAIVSILILPILGCAITGKECVPQAPSSENERSQLIVYRPPHWYGSNYDAPISIDDCIIASLADGAFMRYTVIAGSRKVRAEKRFLAAGGDAEIFAHLAPGESAYVRYAMLPAGTTHLHGAKAGFAITDRISAEKEMPSLRTGLPSQNSPSPR